MLQSMNYFLEKKMPLFIPLIVILGVTVLSGLSAFSHWVQWIFAFISFSSCLSFNLNEVKSTVAKPLPVLVSLIILQLIMPSMAFAAGHLFFAGDIYTITGLILMFTIPTGVITLMWSSIYGGKVGLTLVTVLIGTLLSPLLVPLTLDILIGAQVAIDIVGLIQGLLWMIVIPSLLGMMVNRITKGESKALGKKLAPFSKLSMMLVILINSAVVAPYFEQINGKVVVIFLLVFALACTGYLIGFFTPVMLKWDKSIAVSLMYTSGMRNTGVGAALAVTYFPPATALPVVLAVLFQQFLASFSGQFAERYLSSEKSVRAILKVGKTS
ncbi:bile acid:sodium symporter family protein [Sediminibacillus massiliensis]|uniref:bile acid:sodium symporter family protein n=1 Tax=Sediminibacillus massiliensis TaxID=1926277 RepID=UPI0009885D32|nr:bile acid:sodium symporter family protein [Sediminibacillus massiliensis]